MYYANYKKKHVLSNYFSLLSFSKEKAYGSSLKLYYYVIIFLYFSKSLL